MDISMVASNVSSNFFCKYAQKLFVSNKNDSNLLVFVCTNHKRTEKSTLFLENLKINDQNFYMVINSHAQNFFFMC